MDILKSVCTDNLLNDFTRQAGETKHEKVSDGAARYTEVDGSDIKNLEPVIRLMHKQMKTFEYPMNMKSHKVALKYPLNPPEEQSYDRVELYGVLMAQALINSNEEEDDLPKIYANFGQFYAGDFDAEGFKHGKGIYIFGGGEGYYQGEYFHDKKHGFGRLVYNNGKVKEGRWIDGKFKGTVQKIIKH